MKPADPFDPNRLISISDGQSQHVRTAAEWLALARGSLIPSAVSSPTVADVLKPLSPEAGKLLGDALSPTSTVRATAALHACEGLDTVDLEKNATGWLAEVVHDAAKVEAELAAVTADRDQLLVHQANLVGKIAGLEERLSPPSSTRAPGPLLTEYRRRAAEVDAASKRSQQMERDFLETKVLNHEANAALEEFGRKRGRFGEWLLQVSDDLIAELLSPSSSTSASIDPEILRLARQFIDPESAGARETAIRAIGREIGPKTEGMVREAVMISRELVRLSSAMPATTEPTEEMCAAGMKAWFTYSDKSEYGRYAAVFKAMSAAGAEDSAPKTLDSDTACIRYYERRAEQAMEKDAARYRWIRTYWRRIVSHCERERVKWMSLHSDNTIATNEESVDAAIDAAMKSATDSDISQGER